MKAGVYYGTGDIRIEDMPLPEIGDEEALVQVKSCGLCGTDLQKYLHGLVEPGVVLGHEVAGNVVEAGEKVSRLGAGDRVIVPHHIPCFVCRFCRHGNHTMCEAFKPTRISPGGFAEFIKVAGPSVSKGMLKIPDEISYDEAALVENTACCLRALEKCRLLPGDCVVVVGAGPAGLIHIQLSRALGAGKVLALDLLDWRLEVAKRMGADVVLNARNDDVVAAVKEETGGLGADVVMVAVGSTKALAQAISLARKGGVVNFFAECPPGSSLKIDPNIIYGSEIILLGSYSSTPLELKSALELIHSGRIDVAGLISHRLKLEELKRAFDLASQRKEALKIIINP
ncbi:MAG: hypothetical protein AMS15_04420 [Planctomycetes bacterium DG_23]|nr:MAG: hypothetical protein AMS15_04420 [Planctomycetes bacterium DG_23]